MKPSKIAIAVSLAMVALSGQAMALVGNNANFDPKTTTPDIDVYLSGASAPQATLGALAGTLFGNNTTIDGCAATDTLGVGSPANERFCNFHVLHDSGSLGTDYRAYYGMLKQAFTINGRTLAQGTKVLLTNRARGGSVHGVNPVGKNFPLATMEVLTSNGGTCGNAIAGDTLAYNYTCGAQPSGNDGTSGRRPDFGVSDVAPFMFKQPLNKEPGTGILFDPLTPSEAGNLLKGGNGQAVFGLQFGLPATISVPPTFSVFNGTTSTTVTGFTKAMYAALLTGNIVDWSQIDQNITTGNTQVVVCRRSQGSGTQATYNAYFNNWPCTASSIVPNSDTVPARMQAASNGLTNAITINPADGFTVVENPSSGNVRDCLWRAQTNQNHTYNWTDDKGGVHPVTVTFSNTPGVPYRAIGVLSNDSTEGNNSANNSTGHWTFRDMNGVAGVIAGLPNKADFRTGKWDFLSEVTMQYRIDGFVTKTAIPAGTYVGQAAVSYAIGDFVPLPVTTAVSGTASAAGIQAAANELKRRDFIDLFIRQAGDPAVLNSNPSLVTRAASVALPSANFSPLTDNNVAFVTRSGNMCAPNQWVGF